ncbi:MAG TPA: non-canonical purine NTP pyrophosphatase [Candidatus Fimivivens sp.]|nr:non-canonical purine NTP pyrophosphatase [Candidatus Fimivivens sp.]
MNSITYITGNPGKLAEVKRYLDQEVEHVSLDLPEIQSLSSKEIVEKKAREAYELVGKPVLVEDVSLVIHSLGGLPGPLIKWFEQALGEEGICRLVDGKDRSCTASVLYGYFDGREIIFAEGEMKGSVSDVPRGDNSFGWGPIFVVDGMNDRTYSELTNEEQAEIAMRKKALTVLRERLLNG